ACSRVRRGAPPLRDHGAGPGGRTREGDRVRPGGRGPGRDAALAGARRRARRASARRTHRAGPSHLYGVRAGAHGRRVSCGARRPGAHPVPPPGSTPREVRVSAAARTVEHATCLGCGCACDDITVVVQRGRLTEAKRACALGTAWFGDGQVPDVVRIRGRAGTLERALSEATRLLREAKRPLVYLAGDISCEVQRDAVAIADRLKGAIDSLAGTAAPGVLAAQRRGRAGATLGELRQRADLVVFWGVDPGARYPRYGARYVDPVGLAAPAGRKGRRVIAVDVGDARGPADADGRVTIRPAAELDALGVMRATVQARFIRTD